MKKLTLALFLAAVSSFAQNITGSVNFTGYTASVKFPDSTFDALPTPSSANSGDVYRVTDAATSACAAGGGSTYCHVVSNGTAWVLFAGGTTGGGSGTVTVVSSGSLANNAIVTGGGTTTLKTPATTSTLDASGNMALAGSISTGTGASTAGYLELAQGTSATAGTTSVKLQAPTSVASYIWTLPGTAATGFVYGTNSGGTVTLSQVTDVTRTIASGTAAMTTAAIAAGACGSTVTVAATGVASTDVITFNPNASIKTVTGYSASGGLSIRQWPTANNVNFEVCNGSTASITPGAVTVNWRVQR